MASFNINNLLDLKNFAKDFSKKIKIGNVICLKGGLGSGKTTLVSYICAELNMMQKVQSPTFNILLKYSNNNGLCINHFDLYRLESQEDLEDIGFFEEIDSDAISFIEWPEKFESAMPNNAI